MEWLVVKGVCGFVPDGETTNDSWETLACVMAASVVSSMLSNPFVFEDWLHCGGTVGVHFCNSFGFVFKRSCSLLVFLGIEYRYLLMRTWRLTMELNIYQKTEKHTHSLFFNRVAVKKNFQKV